MGVGWVEIFWSIFHRPLKNPAITLDDATFFGETIPKKMAKLFQVQKLELSSLHAFPHWKSWETKLFFQYLGFVEEEFPVPIWFPSSSHPIFRASSWDTSKMRYPTADKQWLPNPLIDDWIGALYSQNLSNIFGIYHHPWMNGNPFSANQVTRIKIRFLKQSVDKRDDRLRALKRNIIDLDSLSFI